MAQVLERHIEITEGLRGGKAHVVGTRITVSDIVIWHLRLGQSLEEIAARYDLPLASAYAAIAYYLDHKAELDVEIAASRDYYETMKETSPSLVDQKRRAADHD